MLHLFVIILISHYYFFLVTFELLNLRILKSDPIGSPVQVLGKLRIQKIVVVILRWILGAFLPIAVILMLVDVLVLIFFAFPHLVDPIVVLGVASVDDDFLQFPLVHLIFLIVGEILVLFLLPVLDQFAEVVALVILLG